MANDTHLPIGNGVTSVRRVLVPKVEFALEKFLEGRRKRAKGLKGMSKTRNGPWWHPRNQSPATHPE